ncbi:EF-P lysine aminoacylase EpmA [Ostreibacterium oceani]|uniref:EF-P lysine aminoacylase GenX n=1 Tax=Ostreibacterium oceani TaxID=2654998 RepID=A0A6N7EVR0_9GAMM|nr:EF-P lysine aminoacylase EpmA [Ostreibacterium oceani]MPV86641.1 EF-P lysine aminoacylase GenX [Ostreibacterium oceani]
MNKQLVMKARMAMYQDIRQFFGARNVAEIETPLLSPYGSTDLHIDSLSLTYQGRQHFLQTSPEFAMKRWISQFQCDCFQITKVFRDEPPSRRHRCEFTMLEWYRVGFTLTQLIDEVAALLKAINPNLSDLPVEIISYTDAFGRIGIHPLADDLINLQQKTIALLGYDPQLGDCRDAWLDCLMVSFIEKTLGQKQLTFLYDYPASMAALAKKKTNAEGFIVAKRFELYYQGVELANGFDELTDANEQQARFVQDNTRRQAAKKSQIPHDTLLIDALKTMPDCAGVAIGLDRLLMLTLQSETIDAVMPFTDTPM